MIEIAIALFIVMFITYTALVYSVYGGKWDWIINSNKCPDGQILQGSVCVNPCPTGFKLIGDTCQNDSPCPDGTIQQGGSCVNPCPTGFRLVDGTCENQNTPDLIEDDEDCDILCTTGQGYITEDCKCNCFPGYKGIGCSQRICPARNCGDGKVHPDTCLCDCAGLTCLNGGRINPDTCQCECQNGYTGKRCETGNPNLICSNECYNGTLDIDCKCTCDPTFIGSDCRCQAKQCGLGQFNSSTCQCNCDGATPCRNNGYRDPTKECKCQCPPGYSGELCEIANANQVCVGLPCNTIGGSLLTDPCRCQCKTGYGGPDCSCAIKNCGNGYQDLASCECRCNAGWKGPDCRTRDCSYKYCGNGRQDPNTCECDCTGVPCTAGKGAMSSSCQCNCFSGFQGQSCNEPVCPSKYCGIGTLNRNTCQCECPSGYSGDQCQNQNPIITCANMQCQNGQRVADPTCRCQCNYGWSGPDCSIPDPKQLCTSTPCYNGTLKYPCECQCAEGFFGYGCTSRDCSKAGPNGGPVPCEWGSVDENCKCNCWPTYTGPTCGTRDCTSKPCINGTYDSLCNCICKPGFSGADCSKRDCTGTRCQFGRIDPATCKCMCDPGYTGQSCFILEDPNNKGQSLQYNDCITQNGIWTGYQCIKKTGKCPMKNRQVCMNWGGFNYVHDATSTYNWECALGDERNGGTIGDSVDYAKGGRCMTAMSEAGCNILIDDMNCRNF